MGKEMKERSSNTLASQPKPAIISPKPVEQARLTYLESRIGLVSDLKHIDLLFLANQASVAFFGEVVVAPEESLTGRVEKHAWKQREAEEAKHPSNGCREEKWFEKKYVRRKKRVSSKEHMEPTSTSNLVQKSSSLLITMDDAQREQGIYNNGETHSKSEQAEAADGQGHCSGIIKKQPASVPLRLKRQQKNLIKMGSVKPWSEAGLNQAVLESDILGEEMIASESEEFLPLFEEAETEEEGVSNASRCNQWWNFKTRPRASRGVRRHVQWSNKRKRNCTSFEETQRNRKILILAVEAITHQLDLLDVGMEEKSSYK
ncbi:BnaA09g12320D [Brassica napus]|uniref:BnaA09g12320D protein n=1 Tax=Brassica napus TaxID=3708 RepID=A0A078IF89_BRANA|nr:BnaA09g12320D [Brassica napus]